jgi:hypothetical protein
MRPFDQRPRRWKRGEGRTVSLQVLVSEQLAAEIDARCRAQECGRSPYIRRLLARHLRKRRAGGVGRTERP